MIPCEQFYFTFRLCLPSWTPRASGRLLKRSREIRHPYLGPGFRDKTSSLSLVRKGVADFVGGPAWGWGSLLLVLVCGECYDDYLLNSVKSFFCSYWDEQVAFLSRLIHSITFNFMINWNCGFNFAFLRCNPLGQLPTWCVAPFKVCHVGSVDIALKVLRPCSWRTLVSGFLFLWSLWFWDQSDAAFLKRTGTCSLLLFPVTDCGGLVLFW